MDGKVAGMNGTIRMICPSCDELLETDCADDIVSGQPVAAFCPTCARTVEVTAPDGIEAYVGSPVDQIEPSTVSEFPAPQAGTHR